MLTLNQIKSTVSKIGKKYGIKNAHLFGSYAKGKATENSDVDLIVDRGDVHTYKDYFHFYEDLKDALGTEVDITSEDGMYPEFFDIVKGDRILLYGAQ